MKNSIAPLLCFFSFFFAITSCSNSQGNNSATQQVVNNQMQNHEYHENNRSQQQQQIATTTQQKPASSIPPFTFYKVKSGMAFTNDDIPKGKNSAFILYDPSCGHCQIEAAALGKNYNKVKNVNILFISMNDPALQASFLETFAKELVGKPNVQVLYDRNQDFIQKFHVPSMFPANYVYGKDTKLKTWWDGDRDINKVIDAYIK